MNLAKYSDNLGNAKVLIVGDIMLDRYIKGNVCRISPEAPVPVVKTVEESETLGGASNVAHNVARLNAHCALLGVAGVDHYRSSMVNMLNNLHVASIILDSGLSTTTKIRVIGERQQIVRIDYEETLEQDNIVFVEAKKVFSNTLVDYDIVVVSDYGKGFISNDFSKYVIDESNKVGKKTIVDPKGADWSKYKNAYVVTPNVKELAEVYGKPLLNEDNQIIQAGYDVLNRYNLSYLVITRSEKGMTVISKDKVTHIASKAVEVYDVSGAGDTVVSVLACALCVGACINEAAGIANIAAGIVVGKRGTAPITYQELFHEIHRSVSSAVSIDILLPWVEYYKGNGKKIVFTNGCFDILHRGHVDYLRRASELGDILIVGLNSDDSVKRIKGESRPINNQEDRAFILSALEFIDYVVIFDEDTPYDLIRRIKPDILVKGGDYRAEDVVGRQYAGSVVIMDFVEGYSTTRLVNKINGEV